MPGPRRRRRPAPRPAPAIARRLLYAALAAVAGLVLLEGGARLALAAAPDLDEVRPLDAGGALSAELAADPALLWRLIPGRQLAGGVAVRVNDDHMRGPPLPPPGAAPEVLYLGDSSVFGWGVEEAEAFAWSALPPGAVAANAATPGWSSAQARLRLAQVLADRDPDVVVIATLWSDMIQAPWTDRELFARFGSPAAAEALAAHQLRSRSALFRILRAALLSRREVPEDRRILWGRIIRPGPVEDGPRRVAAADARVHLAAMVRAAREDGAEPVLLLLPTNTASALQPEPEVLAAYRENFRAVAAAEDVVLVDGDGILTGRSRAEVGALFLDEVHPSAAGHAALAERLGPAIAAALAR